MASVASRLLAKEEATVVCFRENGLVGWDFLLPFQGTSEYYTIYVLLAVGAVWWRREPFPSSPAVDDVTTRGKYDA